MKLPKEMLPGKYLGEKGRIIAMSKGRLTFNNPEKLYVFNARVVIDKEQVWNGDLSLSDADTISKLKGLAEETERAVFVLNENQGGFSFSGTLDISKFVMQVTPKGKLILGTPKEYYTIKDGVVILGSDYAKSSTNRIEDLVKEPNTLFNNWSSKKTVTLPDLETIMTEGELPYVSFYSYIALKLGVAASDIAPSNVLISKRTAEKLNKFQLDFVKEQIGNDEYSIIKEYSYLNLQYGPCVGRIVGMLDDLVYIRDTDDE